MTEDLIATRALNKSLLTGGIRIIRIRLILVLFKIIQEIGLNDRQERGARFG